MTTYPASIHGVDPVAERGGPNGPPLAADRVAVTDRLTDASLLVVARGAIGRTIEAALSDGPLRVRPLERPPPRGEDDAATIRAGLDERGPVDGVLLVVSRDAALTRVPGPLVDGVPVGVIRADGPDEVEAWLETVRPPIVHAPTWAVLAMGKEEFLEPAGSLRRSLEAAGSTPSADVAVRDWRADRVGRPALCRRLATGPLLAVYLGHARRSGWVGYQALRWDHVSAVAGRRPLGAMVALGCDAFAGPPAATAPFLERFVRTGHAGAAVGPVGAVRTAMLEAVSTRLGTVLHADRPATIGALFRRLIRHADTPSLERHLASYRIVGSPLQPIR